MSFIAPFSLPAFIDRGGEPAFCSSDFKREDELQPMGVLFSSEGLCSSSSAAAVIFCHSLSHSLINTED